MLCDLYRPIASGIILFTEVFVVMLWFRWVDGVEICNFLLWYIHGNRRRIYLLHLEVVVTLPIKPHHNLSVITQRIVVHSTTSASSSLKINPATNRQPTTTRQHRKMKVITVFFFVAAICSKVSTSQEYQDYADGYEQDNLYQDYAMRQQEKVEGGGGG